ncbi:MAG TPA: FAD-dependent oxidoreductase [Thermomicrobiales bacterium]|nr:FAD-dependent oxidoreductase [Thermomicrobiales bacterium]
MKKPIIVAVDDDAEVLQAISHDIRREYGDRFRVVRVDSGARALDVLRQVRLADETVALMVADQRMPGITGVEFLDEAKRLFPDAKRTLLTAYADTDAAIKAINDVHLDYYLMKPWDPPEDRLYPVLDDLLEDWLADYRPAFEGIRLIGHRWSAESHDVRDFLARNQIPFHWLDVATDPKAQELLDLTGPGTRELPVLLFPDGAVLENPSMQAIAEKVGLRHNRDLPLYDLLIVGGGPAGLAAAVYGASEGLRSAIIERHSAGGQAGMSSRIENYLGFPSGLSGEDLARRATTQAQRFGADFLLAHEVKELMVNEGSVGARLTDGSEIRAHSMIISTGVAYRRLNEPGIAELTGRGIYYGAAITEAASIRGEEIFIVGGANSAGQAAIYFANYASKVTMLVRGESLAASMSHYLIERIEQAPNIEVRCQTAVVQADGDGHLESLVLRDSVTRACERVPARSMFIFIGAVPPTDWLKDKVLLDERGFILTGPDVLATDKSAWKLDRDPLLLETSVPGIFAAGDVRHGSGKRVATAVGEGAMAVMSVWQYRAQAGL